CYLRSRGDSWLSQPHPIQRREACLLSRWFMGAQLVIIAGPDVGGIFALSPGVPLLIGRGRDTATRLTDPRVSRVHCEVQLDRGQVVLKDRGSHGGTAVNGQRVTEQPLRAGDVIRVG